MFKRKKKKGSDYIDEVLQNAVEDDLLIPTPGQMPTVRIEHDPDCSFFCGGDCDCRPAIYQEIKPKKKR